MIYFGDEAGFEATAQYGTIWASQGETAVIETTGQRPQVNFISAVSKGAVCGLWSLKKSLRPLLLFPF